MNQESFSDPAIAEILNKNFIPIKVDREQRPDVDAIYTMYMHVTTGQGGWPLNVFLAPNSLSPFYGGMYWPSNIANDDSKTTFDQILKSVVDVWERDPAKCIESSEAIKTRLISLHDAQSGAEYDELRLSIFDEVRDHFNRHFDSTYGGFSTSPKFPCPHNISFLLKFGRYLDQPESEQTFKEKSLFTLRKIGGSALKDQLGHGFSRYSVTVDWSLPHFEKLLIDQALLLASYTHAYQVTWGEARDTYLHYMTDLIKYITGTLLSESGGFYSAQDSDSLPSRSILKQELDVGQYPKAEGAFYLWQYNDFDTPLTRFESDVACAHWNVQELGNINTEFDVYRNLAFQNTLYTAMEPKEIGQFFGRKESLIRETIESAREKLSKYRDETREKPLIDEKILTGWNGAAIGALAQAGNALAETDPELSKLALDRAAKAAEFVYTNLFDESQGALLRMFSYGKPSTTLGMNDDYAYLISGLLDLYQATFNVKYLDWARRLQEIQLVYFWDSKNGGFYTVPKNESAKNEELFLVPKNGFDSAEPSSNGVSCENLFRLSGFLNDPFFKSHAEEILECYGKELTAQPFGYCSMLGSVAAHLKGITSIIVVGLENSETKDSLQLLMTQLTRDQLIPNLTINRITQANVDDYYENYGNVLYGALQDKYGTGPLKFIVCQNLVCTEPLDSVAEVLAQVQSIMHPSARA